jgi:uncharacterized protein YggE
VRSKYQFVVLTVAVAMIVLLVGGLALSLAGFGLPTAEAQASPAAQADTPARTITVVGEGKVTTKPDVAQANIGVQVIGADPKQATSDAAALMEKLMEALKAQGVAENDIQTSYYNLWVDRPYNPDGSQSAEAIYRVNNNVQVTIRDLSKVTTILGAAIEAGANTIDSVTFNLADSSTLRSEARQKAVADAKIKAEELATLNEVQVGDVVSVSEVVVNVPFFAANVGYAAEGLGGGAGPIVPGEVEVSVQLQVTYAIQ